MPQSIPLNCKDNAGAGFLVTDGSSTWLTTCAHLVTGINDAIFDPSFFNGAMIRVVTNGNFIPLIVNARQRFEVVKRNAAGNLIDALTIKLLPSEIASLSQFGVYDAGSISKIKIGDIVSVLGFPGLQQTVLPEISFEAKITGFDGTRFALSEPSADGFSGGPVINNEGLVGIVYGDTGTKPKFEQAVAVSLAATKAYLFK